MVQKLEGHTRESQIYPLSSHGGCAKILLFCTELPAGAQGALADSDTRANASLARRAARANMTPRLTYGRLQEDTYF